ncbi:unnamed protein product [Prunus armeniaca]
MGLETKINKSDRSLTGLNRVTTVTVDRIDLDVYSPIVINSQTFWVIDKGIAIKCSIQELKKSKQTQFLPVNQVNLKGADQTKEKADPILDSQADLKGSYEEGWKREKDVELIPLHPDKLERKVQIGSRLSLEEKAERATLLQENKHVFAWTPFDMLGIDAQITCHCLHINPIIKPVAQKRCNFALEQVAIIEAEINKLLATGFIEEVSHTEWLVVLVAKKDKCLWRVCVDYTDLNKACPKTNFPLPIID